MQRMPRLYLAVLAAGATALVLKLIYASITDYAITNLVTDRVADYMDGHLPAMWHVVVGIHVAIFLAPAAVAVWVGRLYEAVFAQRLLAVVLVGLAGALANQIANTICEMVGTHGRLHFFAMWQMYGMIFLVTAAVYAVATGVLAAVVALWKSRLSMPQAPPPPQSSPEPPAANTPSS